MEEVWKEVVDATGYEVSSWGRVRCNLVQPPRLVEPSVVLGDRLNVPLSVSGKTKQKRLHLLVLETFVGCGGDNQECVFKDGDYTNCRLDNLEWADRTKKTHGHNKTKIGDVIGNFEAVSVFGYPPGSHSLHWNVKCVRCARQYVTQGQQFRTERCLCDNCDFVRFSNCELTTLKQVDDGPVRKLREYKKWLDARNRCNNRQQYKDKGIKVCAEWDNDFRQFFIDVGPQPGPDFILDRYPDCDGDYRPGNIRWATPRQSNENRSNSVKPHAS